MTRKYQITIWWSERDDAFLAMAPQLPQCIMDGSTPEAALAELNLAMDEWLELAREEGWTLPQVSGTLLPVQDELDWKRLPDEETEARAASPSAARRSTKPKTSRRITSRSTHATT